MLIDSEDSNKNKKLKLENLPFPAIEAATFQYKTSVTVGSTDADYTDIQSAIDALTDGGLIYLKD